VDSRRPDFPEFLSPRTKLTWVSSKGWPNKRTVFNVSQPQISFLWHLHLHLHLTCLSLQDMSELPSIHSSDQSAVNTKTENESSNFILEEQQDGGLKGWMTVVGWQVSCLRISYILTQILPTAGSFYLVPWGELVI